MTLRSWAGNIYRRASHWHKRQREQSRLPRCSAAPVPCSKRAELLLQGTSSWRHAAPARVYRENQRRRALRAGAACLGAPACVPHLVAAPFSTASMLILLSDLVVWYAVCLTGQPAPCGVTLFSACRETKPEQKKCCHVPGSSLSLRVRQDCARGTWRAARYRAPCAPPRRNHGPLARCMEGPSLIRNYHNMGKRKGGYSASTEEASAGDPNPTARLVLALLLLLVIMSIAFFVWRRARNRGPHCARHPIPRAWDSA